MKHLTRVCRLQRFRRAAPPWRDDPVAQMFNIAHLGCPECGHGAIEERDRLAALAERGDEDR